MIQIHGFVARSETGAKEIEKRGYTKSTKVGTKDTKRFVFFVMAFVLFVMPLLLSLPRRAR